MTQGRRGARVRDVTRELVHVRTLVPHDKDVTT